MAASSSRSIAFPPDLTRHPPPSTHHPLPATHHPLFATRHPPIASPKRISAPAPTTHTHARTHLIPLLHLTRHTPSMPLPQPVAPCRAPFHSTPHRTHSTTPPHHNTPRRTTPPPPPNHTSDHTTVPHPTLDRIRRTKTSYRGTLSRCT